MKSQIRPNRSRMAAALALGLAVAASGCGRGGAAGGPYVATASEIKVEYVPLEVPKSLAPGAAAVVKLQVKNVGKDAWPSSGPTPLRFGYHWSDPVGTGSWNAIVWDDGNRGFLPADLAPGARVVVTLPVKALNRPAREAKLVVQPILEGAPNGWGVDAPFVASIDVQ